MSFELREDHLEAMFALANFAVPPDEMIFFGLRGASPLDITSEIATGHKLVEQGVDFRHLRCSIGQWVPGEGFALFPGSTVPQGASVAEKVGEDGAGVNLLAPCYLTDLPGSSDHRYLKGDHGHDHPDGPHRAFRTNERLPVWRTGNDAVYAGNDRLVYEQAFDNLHCARHLDPTQPGFASLGCQVVAGIPGGPLANPGGEKGPWKAFVERAYGRGQKRFRYALFNEREALRTVEFGADKRSPTVRFGSTGELVENLQRALLGRDFDIGDAGADGVLGFQTLSALRQVQLEAFGPTGVDLVAGPQTAAELGITWPGPGQAKAKFTPADPAPAAAAAPGLAQGFAAGIESIEKKGGKRSYHFLDGKVRISLGDEVTYKGLAGLSRLRGFKTESEPSYDHADWLDTYGAWAAFVEPTGEGESFSRFCCINSYDRAAFTFGFQQLAAHTPGRNLVALFRTLLASPEAAIYFPDLTIEAGQVAERRDGGLVILEGSHDRADGKNRKGEQGRFMEYLNADMTRTDESELRAASRLVHWARTSSIHRAAQVGLAVETAREHLESLEKALAAHKLSLDGRGLPELAMALDIRHHGRGTNKAIAAALAAKHPMDALVKIGAAGHADRIKRVRARAEDLLGKGDFGTLCYSVAARDFV